VLDIIQQKRAAYIDVFLVYIGDSFIKALDNTKTAVGAVN
jgi:hypothetical protein